MRLHLRWADGQLADRQTKQTYTQSCKGLTITILHYTNHSLTLPSDVSSTVKQNFIICPI